jgi:hypothetical protein
MANQVTMPWIELLIAQIRAMRYFRQLLFIMIVFLVSSCSRTGIVNDVTVKLVKPDKVVSLEFDTTFRCAFPEVLDCFRIRIVNDTILVLQDQVSENNPYHFKAYSTNSFDYLGSFVRIGRGPGEMLHPHITQNNASEKYLSLNDNQLGQAYILDVIESIKAQKASTVKSFSLPSNIIDWLPMSGNGQFILVQENGEMVFHKKMDDVEVCKTFHLYGGIDGERCLTHFSGFILNNGITGEVAEVMAFFPQINIIDTYSENVHSIAVNKDYCRWESVINRMLDMDSKEYYAGATSTSDYIFAAYKGLPLCRLNDPGAGTSIHVFDWADNFLYDIRVSENIDYMTFDSRTKFLYCVAKPENCIVRYDMSGLL